MPAWEVIYDNYKYFMKNLTYIAIWSSREKQCIFVFNATSYIPSPPTIKQEQNEILYLPLRFFILVPFYRFQWLLVKDQIILYRWLQSKKSLYIYNFLA